MSRSRISFIFTLLPGSALTMTEIMKEKGRYIVFLRKANNKYLPTYSY